MKTLTKMFSIWCWCICLCTFALADGTAQKPVQDSIEPPTQRLTDQQKLQILQDDLSEAENLNLYAKSVHLSATEPAFTRTPTISIISPFFKFFFANTPIPALAILDFAK